MCGGVVWVCGVEVWCRVSVELGAHGGHGSPLLWGWEEDGVCCIALRGRGWEEGVIGYTNINQNLRWWWCVQ